MPENLSFDGRLTICTGILSGRPAVERPDVPRSTIDLFKENTLFGCTQDRQHHHCLAWIKLRGLHTLVVHHWLIVVCPLLSDGFILLILDDPACCPFYFHLSVNLQGMFFILYYFVLFQLEINSLPYPDSSIA